MTINIESASLDLSTQSMDSLSTVVRSPAVKADAAEAQPKGTVTTEQVTAAVQQLQSAIAKTPNPDFSLDYLSGLSVVKVRSNTTGEVVFQVPDTRVVELARLLKDGASLGSLGLINTEV